MDQSELEQSLRSAGSASPAEWQRVRAALAAGAEREGLIDVAYERHETPLGTIVVGATREGLVRIALPSEDEDDVLAELAARISPRVLRSSRESLAQTRRELDEYFGHDRRSFGVPLDWRLVGGFRREVLRATAQIPYGRTASYRDVATSAGSPNAVRAAGTALATNPLPIVVPCHRVLRSGGGLGQYRGGPEAKAQLLQLEGAA
ncbi:MAG TPA: methylated-DNA--[protein]-cysteine S-methyltransferase [Gaiellales bacterium]